MSFGWLGHNMTPEVLQQLRDEHLDQSWPHMSVIVDPSVSLYVQVSEWLHKQYPGYDKSGKYAYSSVLRYVLNCCYLVVRFRKSEDHVLFEITWQGISESF